jgi:Transcriptional regulators of sugar metabolism
MLTEERQQIILNQLKIHNIVKLHDLIPLTGASASTLRRDLQDLEDCHKLLRIHGGAQNVISLHDEPALSQKSDYPHRQQKRVSVDSLVVWLTIMK